MISKQGWINLYKPKNITSFKAINSIKKKFSINKKARELITFPEKDIVTISREDLLEEYSALAKDFISQQNKNNEILMKSSIRSIQCPLSIYRHYN